MNEAKATALIDAFENIVFMHGWESCKGNAFPMTRLIEAARALKAGLMAVPAAVLAAVPEVATYAEGEFPLDPDALSEIKARAAAATPGPWVEDDGNIFCKALVDARYEAIMAKLDGKPHDPARLTWYGEVAKCHQGLDNFDPDSVFIAHARTDVDRLIKEVETQWAIAVDRGQEMQRLVERYNACAEEFNALEQSHAVLKTEHEALDNQLARAHEGWVERVRALENALRLMTAERDALASVNAELRRPRIALVRSGGEYDPQNEYRCTVHGAFWAHEPECPSCLQAAVPK